MQAFHETPQSHLCESLQLLRFAKDRVGGLTMPPDADTLGLIRAAEGRCWRALNALQAERQAGQGPQPLAPWWYRVRRFARRAGTIAWALVVLAVPMVGQGSLGPRADAPSASWLMLNSPQFIPSASYEQWWDQLVVACGCEPATDFYSIVWRQYPQATFYCPETGDACLGQWFGSGVNTIVLARDERDDSRTVRHEMLHAILGRGDHPPIFRRLALLNY